MHGNELPLRHLLATMDGKTSGPRGFTGPVGKLLSSCESLPVVDFESIVSDFVQTDALDLSSDQKYLYEMCHAISSGYVSRDLALRAPGNMSHARWLTTANRILRLYVASEAPSANLLSLTTFVMRVYAPMWFLIKSRQYVQDGPIVLFHTLKAIREFDIKVKKIVIPVVQRNGYFAHPENLLLAMIGDQRPHIRQLAWRRIKKARTIASTNSSSEVRKFTIPKINPECEDYSNLINWMDVTLTEPPLTKCLSDEMIEENIISQQYFSAPKFPLHTQAVERVIKLVSDASLQVCSHEAREGYIGLRISSRQKIPSFNSKKDYVLEA